jgi:hypothetical protein
LNNPNIEYYQKHAQILTKRYETAVVTKLHHLLKSAFPAGARVLRPHGRLFFSVPLKRDDMQADERDRKGRRFTAMTADNWYALCRKNGFDIIATTISGDGLGRSGIFWFNCLGQRRV